MTGSAFVAVEWGTQRWRARVIGADASVLDERSEAVALATLGCDGIAAHVADWAAMWPEPAGRALLLSGMIGSPMGWGDVPRIDCPATPDAIAAAAQRVTIGTLDAVILPGLACTSRFGEPDVLRGEEVAAVGVAARNDTATLVSVPGMHGKWLRLAGGTIRDFHSAMTVELLRTIAAHTILTTLMTEPARDGEAFRRGVRAGAAGGALARRLFGVRAAVQTGTLDAREAGATVAGILIGSDVAEGLGDQSGQCVVMGDPDITRLFAAAIEELGGSAEMLDDARVTAEGFARLAAAVCERGGA